VVADIDGDDSVVRQVPRQRVEDRRGGHATASFVSGPPGLFRSPDGPPGRHGRALVLGAGRAQFLEQRVQRERGVAHDSGADRVEAADGRRVVVDLQDGFVRRDPGVIGKRGADHDQQVGLVHQPARYGRAAAAEHSGAQRVGVRDQALGLEGGQDRRVEPLGEAAERPGGPPGAVPGDQHRAPAGRDHGGGAGNLRLARLGEPHGQPALRGLGGGVTGLSLDFVGQD
jgi:hypothetical protein